MKFIPFLILIFIFQICGGMKGFQTKSIYRAPVSALQIEVESSGIIESGADVSDNSESRVKIFSTRNNLPELILGLKRLPQKEEIRLNGVPQNTKLLAAIVQNLQSLGYPTSNVDELNEIVSAIYGTSSGPKGTRLKDQTKFLEVVSVDSKYK